MPVGVFNNNLVAADELGCCVLQQGLTLLVSQLSIYLT